MSDLFTENREAPVASGVWGEEASWEIYLSSQVPPAELCTAVACVAIANASKGEVVLTRNQRGWEILAGHIDEGETPEEALAREAIEEGGFVITRMMPFCYREITALGPQAASGREASYPYPTSYMPYFVAFTDVQIGAFTGIEIIETRTFTAAERQELLVRGEISKMEHKIIELGLASIAA